MEPLARYDEKGNMLPWLAEEIPTVENGGVSKDLTSITWKIKSGIKWSDGTSLTADDVVFTHAYCTHPDTGCAHTNYYSVDQAATNGSGKGASFYVDRSSGLVNNVYVNKPGSGYATGNTITLPAEKIGRSVNGASFPSPINSSRSRKETSSNTG